MKCLSTLIVAIISFLAAITLCIFLSLPKGDYNEYFPGSGFDEFDLYGNIEFEYSQVIKEFNIDPLITKNKLYSSKLENIINNIDQVVLILHSSEGELNIDQFLAALTDSVVDKCPLYSLEVLYEYLSFADRILELSKDAEDPFFYMALNSFYYNYCAMQLEKISHGKKKGFNSFRYRYLVQRCNENKCGVNIYISDAEKVFINLRNWNIPYLINRFFNTTNTWFKVMVGMGFLMVVFVFLYGVKSLIFRK